MQKLRKPAVAGSFYPADPDELRKEIDTYLLLAKTSTLEIQQAHAFIVPHAGYIYSGIVAAAAYKIIQTLSKIKTVFLLGPAHRVYTPCIALSGQDTWLTPLGKVEVDMHLTQTLTQLPVCQVFDETHQLEHSLEVQIPFLQCVLPNFKIVPMVVGDVPPHEVDVLIKTIWHVPDSIILVSSDLSHYLPYQDAKIVDQQSIQQILQLQMLDTDQACGAHPINGLMSFAQQHPLQSVLLDARNSGDTAGSKDQVVGYCSMAFWD